MSQTNGAEVPKPKKERWVSIEWKKLRSTVNYGLSRLLNYVVQKINGIDRRLFHYVYNPNPKFFEDLAPDKDVKNAGEYMEALRWALRNLNIKNIALTGPYGSGKSSILKSFEKQHPEFRYLNISLATFDEKKPEAQKKAEKSGQALIIQKEEKGDEAEQRKLVETSILQQIFYHVKNSKIPDSRFKRIKRIGWFKQLLFSLGFITWLIAGIYLFKPQFLSKFSFIADLQVRYPKQFQRALPLLFLLGTVRGIFMLYRSLRNKKFTKLNLTSGEVELAQQESSSILNKYLDEILYFFENNPFDVVIIEDLDRFNDPEIFIKLREINTLINNSRQINRRVVFIYAVRDNMFVDKDRAKFFDFLIPVIPVINASNSIDKLLEKLDRAGLRGVIKYDFISDITLFIEDMRMLKNLINEYIIYKAKIGSKLNPDKLLAMIIYKNLYPSDFADLHVGKGKVYQILMDKETIIQKELRQIDTKIRAIENVLQQIEQVRLKNIKELRSLYVLKIIEHLPNEAQPTLIGINHVSYPIKTLTEDDKFQEFLDAPNYQYYHLNYSRYYALGFVFKDLEKEVDPQDTYSTRANYLQQKADSEKNKLRTQIEELKRERLALREKTLSEILQNATELVESIKADKLLVYLLRYGYIDEHYYTYISYFYEGNITKEDNDFVLSVKNKEAKPANFKLEKIDPVIKKLRLAEFSQPETLNHFLIDFLFEHSITYPEQLNRILSQITSKTAPGLSFLDSYLQEGNRKGPFIALLVEKWPGLFQYIEKESSFTTEKKDAYLRLIIEHAPIDGIIALNEGKVLSQYIARTKTFLNGWPLQLHSKIKELIKRLGASFKELDVSEEATPLFDFVYENNYYEINPQMLGVIFTQKGRAGDIDSLQWANWTTIQASGLTHLTSYLEVNLIIYLGDVFAELPDNKQESEAALIDLLNRVDEDDDELYEAIVEGQQMQIQDVESVQKKSWRGIIKKVMLRPTWKNVLAVYADWEDLDEDLTAYLNQPIVLEALSNETLEGVEGYEEEFILEFKTALVLNNNLSDDVYSKLLENMSVVFDELDLSDLFKEKVTTLVQQQKLSLTLENYSTLKNGFAPLHIRFLLHNLTEFMSRLGEFTLDGGDFTALIQSKQLKTEQLQILVNTLDDGLLTPNSRLVEELFGVTMGLRLKLSPPVYHKLFSLLSGIMKIHLLTGQMPYLSKEQITNSLVLIGEPYAAITTTGNPLLESNELNLNLAKTLQAMGYISSWGDDDKGIRIYTWKK